MNLLQTKLVAPERGEGGFAARGVCNLPVE